MRIVKIEDGGVHPTFDVECKENHEYLQGNGCVSHNSSASSYGKSEGVEPIQDLIFTRAGGVPVTCVLHQDPKVLSQYVKGFDIPNEQLIKLAAVRQKFLDQGQSVSLYYKDDSVSMKQAYEDRLLAHKLGLKSIYYLKFKKRSDDDICESCS